MKGENEMANYVSTTSDKTKAGAKRRLFIGGLGLQYFYVGRIGAGFLRLLIGLLLWGVIITGIVQKEAAPVIVAPAVALVVINLVELAIIALGRFRDNTGAFLRQ